ncbi:MAG: adenosylcobinamide amidohydrolase [Candidatus Lokiarchaeota archaeon]|nr:adenosylcobinamide amidohydrolase [Candidatus Lokiarchaeota archaeon]
MDKKNIVFNSKREMQCISNAAVNGGRIKAHSIVNHHVKLDFNFTSLENIFEPIQKKYNLIEPTIGLLTAVKMEEAVLINEKIDNINFTVVLTAGLSNSIAPFDCEGVNNDYKHEKNYKPGTINIIILFDCKLTEYALVNLIITLTEAKTLLLSKYNIRTSNNNQATGTSTDTITIGYLGNIPLVKWTGYSTKFGQYVGKTVYSCLEKAIRKWRD